MKTINMTDAEATLLLKVLKENIDERSSMGCNDPNEDEENLFSKKERLKMQKVIGELSEEEIEENGGMMCNWEYSAYLRKMIKKQLK